ncbi:cysteine synthase A [candidate division WOR-3 bacterium]|uniref:cysteine synthase n=1 Tax=candidate division WOR-3 bacterium TaxID=2052148 RepID=A0A9D5QCR7_UNCW3|nr:cysteine synthase A [candidate division WOR-3 bacterium]MBD3364271.1 cysteine synthase A [candidate division WOR-3 bacterium]
MNICENLLDLIGNTPMVYLREFGKGLNATLMAKLEMFNPFSIKDRPISYMIAAGERDGKINKDTTIIEATSGNTGLALALVCAVKGYRLIICMSEIQSEERKHLLRILGAELVLTPASKGTKGAKKRAMALLEEIPNSYYIEQHSNPANPLAHQETTARELWEDTDGKIDILVAGLGTSGTLMGTARAIKPKKPEFKVVGVEPEIAPMVSKGIFKPHRQMGTSPGFVPKILDRGLLDEIITVSEEASFETCRELARKEGILAGITSGMTAWAARKLAGRPENEGKLIVAVFADTGERYLSVEGLYT